MVEALERGLRLRVEDNADSDTDQDAQIDEPTVAEDVAVAGDADLAIDLTSESEPDATPE